MVVALFFVFPFYWVIISSLKTPAGMSMRPPAFYPCVEAEDDCIIDTADRVVLGDGHRWLKLTDAGEGFGYYLQFDEGRKSKFVRKMMFSDMTPVHAQSADLLLKELPLVKIKGGQGVRAVVARMLRQIDGSSEERLFVVSKENRGVECLVNPQYKGVRRFKARWENYPETLKGPEASVGSDSGAGFILFMRNSFFISIMAVIGQVFSSSFVAFGFARLHFKGRNVLFVVLLATMMVPAQVTLIPLFSIYKTLGWIDTFLPLIVPHFTAGAFNVFLLRQYMLTLPKELDESATIDGCGPFQTYWRVIMPNCVPVMIVVALFTFVATWQSVMGPLIYLDNPEYRTVTLGLEYFRSPYVDNRHLIITGAVLAMLPVAGVFLVLQRYIMAGIATTGLKG